MYLTNKKDILNMTQKPQKLPTNDYPKTPQKPRQKLPKKPQLVQTNLSKNFFGDAIYTIFRTFLSPPPSAVFFFTLAMKVEKIASIAYRVDYQRQIAYQIAYFFEKSRTKPKNRVPKTPKSNKNL